MTGKGDPRRPPTSPSAVNDHVPRQPTRSKLTSMPQSSGRDASALSQSLQLRPGNGDRDFAIAGSRLKAAIVTEDHVLTAGDTGPALDAVGNRLGVLNHHMGMRDCARDQELSVGHLDAPHPPPLVLVPRVGG